MFGYAVKGKGVDNSISAPRLSVCVGEWGMEDVGHLPRERYAHTTRQCIMVKYIRLLKEARGGQWRLEEVEFKAAQDLDWL